MSTKLAESDDITVIKTPTDIPNAYQVHMDKIKEAGLKRQAENNPNNWIVFSFMTEIEYRCYYSILEWGRKVA